MTEKSFFEELELAFAGYRETYAKLREEALRIIKERHTQ